MSSTEPEIAVEDPTAPAEEFAACYQHADRRNGCLFVLLGLALLLAFDNWRTGMGWEAEGPQAGYFPFYLSVILAAASVYGLVAIFLSRRTSGETFVTRDQLRRVMQVFVPDIPVLPVDAMARALCRELPADRGLHVDGRTHRAVEIAAHQLRVFARHVRHL